MKEKGEKGLSALLAFLLFAGCGSAEGGEGAGISGEGPAVEAGGAHFAYAEEDYDAEWAKGAGLTQIRLSGKDAQVSGEGASFSGGILHIEKEGSYILSGTLSGSVEIEAGGDGVVRLCLNGASIASEGATAIQAKKTAKLILTVAEGTENTVSGGSAISEESGGSSGESLHAAIYATGDMTINGAGSLKAESPVYEAIAAKGVLALTGTGKITAQAANDGVRGKEAFAMLSGTLDIIAGNDGIKASGSGEGEGAVVIDGGSATIKAGGDGIQAESSASIYGGSFSISTGSGAGEPIAASEESGRGWGRMPQPGDAAQPSGNEGESKSYKGVKAQTSLVIAGGTLKFDTEDDAVHSNDSLQLLGGSLEIKTGDDGMHADGALVISGSSSHVNITQSYEGIEAATIEMQGGSVRIVASDDAVNAAGGNDDADGQGPMGFDQFFDSDSEFYFRMSGGTLEAKGGRDGIDANGNIYLEGGDARISALSRGMDGAIDLDRTLEVSGGTLVTAGSCAAPASSSKQPVLLASFDESHPAGTVIELKRENETILSYTSEIGFTAAAFSSPSLEDGKSYAVFLGGKEVCTAKIAGASTAVGESGEYAIQGGGRPNGGAPGGKGPAGGGMFRPRQ
jgi:hypothetical protein